MWVYVESLPSTSWPITKSYFESSSMPIIDADPDVGIMLIKYFDSLNLKITISMVLKRSTEIFLTTYLTDPNAPNASASLSSKRTQQNSRVFCKFCISFSGTSLATNKKLK